MLSPPYRGCAQCRRAAATVEKEPMNTIYSGLENPIAPLAWKYVFGPAISPQKPDGFSIERLPTGVLKVSIIGIAYAGELGSLELPLPPNSGRFSFSYVLVPDDA